MTVQFSLKCHQKNKINEKKSENTKNILFIAFELSSYLLEEQF